MKWINMLHIYIIVKKIKGKKVHENDLATFGNFLTFLEVIPSGTTQGWVFLWPQHGLPPPSPFGWFFGIY
jgi:hypothetical protein